MESHITHDTFRGSRLLVAVAGLHFVGGFEPRQIAAAMREHGQPTADAAYVRRLLYQYAEIVGQGLRALAAPLAAAELGLTADEVIIEVDGLPVICRWDDREETRAIVLRADAERWSVDRLAKKLAKRRARLVGGAQ